MNTFKPTSLDKTNNFRSLFGLILIISGGILFLDRYLQTGWLSLAIMPIVGIFLFLYGIRQHYARLMLIGGLVAGAGIGVAASLNPLTTPEPILIQLGLLTLSMAIAWGITALAIPLYSDKSAWWILVPVGILAGIGGGILFSPLRWTDFVLSVGLGLGLAFLIWSFITGLFGLLIPGSLITTITAGIYFGWQGGEDANTLVQTGVMLVWFSLGWILISLGSKFLLNRSVWWPLIPGGILAVVGFGLYIGGDSGNALGFISNTGAIVLMIFGLYLLLMRKGIHHD